MYQIHDPKCNGMKNPVGLIDKLPRFSWKLSTDLNDLKQQNYRIRVQNEQKTLVWDSGTVESTAVFDIPYNGSPLCSHTDYTWSVISVATNSDKATSPHQYFSTAMLEGEWKAQWIEPTLSRKPLTDCTEMWKVFTGMVTSLEHPEEVLDPPVYLRRNFTISKPVAKAKAYATAHGIYELQLNGKVISAPLAPGYTVYKDYLAVQQYDITACLNRGTNCIGTILADGWYTGKIGFTGIGNQYGDTTAFYLQLELFYNDGTHETITSDEQFRWTTGNYAYADLFVGERYIQDKISSKWNSADFDDRSWQKVAVKNYGTANFAGQECEPVRVLRTISKPAFLNSPKGELIVDAGENIVGYPRITMHGKVGQTVKLTHSEVLDRDGNFLMNIMGQHKNQCDIFIFTRDSMVNYTPCFTFHGFRYIKVEGISTDNIESIEIDILGTDLDHSGSFSTSCDLINRLQENIVRSQSGNMLEIPTDCPQRERAGWTGDMQVYTPTACFNMDVYAFLSRWLKNMRYEQLPDGQVPNIIPSMESDKYIHFSQNKHISCAGWSDACMIIPWFLYQYYGKIEVLVDNFDMIHRWMDYVENQARTSHPKAAGVYSPEELERQQYLWNTEFHFGDWLYPSAVKEAEGNPILSAERTKEYVPAAMFAYTSRLMSKICTALNKKELAAHYRALNNNIRRAFAAEYIDSDGKMPVHIQGLYVLALQFDLYPANKKSMGIKHLKELIASNNGSLDTGFLSTPFLLDTLYENGEKELAYSLLYRETCPSWLYAVTQGATTIWESWAAIQPDGTRTNSSYNHFAFGSIGDFIYRRIGGLFPLEAGFRQIKISPDFDCGLAHARLSYNSNYGKIEVNWHKKAKGLLLEISLPVNVSGIVECNGQSYEVTSGKTTFTT